MPDSGPVIPQRFPHGVRLGPGQVGEALAEGYGPVLAGLSQLGGQLGELAHGQRLLGPDVKLGPHLQRPRRIGRNPIGQIYLDLAVSIGRGQQQGNLQTGPGQDPVTSDGASATNPARSTAGRWR